MTMLEQKGSTVLFGGDREFVTGTENREVGGLQLDAAARGARVGAHCPRYGDRGLLRQLAQFLPRRFGHFFLGEHRLHVPGAVAQRDESDLAARTGSHYPTAATRPIWAGQHSWHRLQQ